MPRSYLRERFEETPAHEGADVAKSTKELYSPAMSLENAPEPSVLERDDELRGADEPLMVFEDEHNPTWTYNSRAYPDLLGWRLTHILGAPETIVGDGEVTDPDGNVVPVGAFMHVWQAPFGPAGPSPLTADVLAGYKDEDVFVQLTGCGAEELSISSGEAGGVRVASNGPALFYAAVDDPEDEPAAESLAIRPFMRRGCVVKLWQGNVLNIENFDVTVASPIEVARTMGVMSGYPSLIEKAEGPIVVTISVPKRHLAAADLQALLRAERFAMKTLWESQSEIGATGYPYRAWLEGDGAQYTGGGPAALENKRRVGAEYTAKLTSDGVGASSKFTLVNATEEYVAFGS